LAAIAAIWGSSFLLIEIGLRSFPPGVVTLARVALGTVTLALFARARLPVDREDWGRIALLGTVWMAVPLTLLPIAQQWIDSGVTGMINGSMPIFAAAWATYFLRRLPGWRQLLGIGVGFVGIVLVFIPELQASADTALGAFVALVAIVFYGLATNLAVPLQQKYGAAPVVLRAQLVALVLVLPLGLWQLPQATWSAESALAMVPLGALGTGLAIVLMATLAGRVGAPRASIAIYFLPVVAVGLGVLVLGESVAPIALAGVALVLVGAWIASRREG
jgi:drug/metabolite transporter (DMT)-like permease